MSTHAPAALAYHGRGLHPIVVKPNSKVPLSQGWQHHVNRTAAEVREDFERAPEGHGIGTVTHGFVVIDLDVRPNKNGVESLASLPPLPPTLTSTTPSGGQHRFFRIPRGTAIRNSASKLGPGIDVRGTGGQVVLPPTVIDGKPYRWLDGSPEEMAGLPEPWLSLLTSTDAEPPAPAALPTPSLRVVRSVPDVAFEADRRARYMATLTEQSVQGSGGNAVMMRAAFHAKEMSRNADEALAALLEWNSRNASPLWSEAELARAIANSEAVFGAGLDRPEAPVVLAAGASDEQGRPLCVAYAQPTSRYIGRTEDGTAWALDAGMDQGAARRVLIANGFSPSDAKRILDDHTVVHAVAVDTIPNAPPVVVRDGRTVVNAWVPPSITPAPGTFPVLDEVLTFVSGSPEGKAWLMNWLAAALQRPAERFRTAPILSGQQRTGKSVLIRAIRALIGEGNSKNIRSEDITSRFSAAFATSLLVAVGEIETADLDAAQGSLRYLTGEDRIMVEGKFAAAKEVKNRLKLIGSTNKRDPVRVDAKDTRWTILRQNAEASPEYLARIETLFDGSEWSERGLAEVRALGHHLISMTIDERVTNVPLKNTARAEAIKMSRSSVQAFADAVDDETLDGLWVHTVPQHQRGDPAYQYLDVPGRPGVASSAAVYALYRAFALGRGQQPVGANRFAPELSEARPEWELLGQVGSDDRRIRVSPKVKLGAWGNLPRDPSLRSAGPVVAPVVEEPPPKGQAAVPEPPAQLQFAGSDVTPGAKREQQLASAAALLGGRITGRA
jgi:hypothetical protein